MPKNSTSVPKNKNMSIIFKISNDVHTKQANQKSFQTRRQHCCDPQCCNSSGSKVHHDNCYYFPSTVQRINVTKPAPIPKPSNIGPAENSNTELMIVALVSASVIVLVIIVIVGKSFSFSTIHCIQFNGL